MSKVAVWIGLILTLLPALCLGAPRDAEWKKVDEAVQKGLPKTAIEALEPIIQGALKDKAWGEATKAVARKIVLEGNIQGNKPEEKIVRLEAELAKAPKEMQPLLQTVLANWYWHFFQNNRWRFVQRTATAQAPGKDFATWDLPRLFAEIDQHFQQALAAAPLLQKTPVSDFDELLLKGNMPDKYRPTLYDFIGHEALQFYSSAEQAAAKPQDAFEVPAESPIFGSATEFMAWRPETTQTNSPVLAAIRLYQQLLKFHEKDNDPSAFADADLARLAWGYNVAFGEKKNARYKEALKAFAEKWNSHELSAQAIAYWARVVFDEGDRVEARKLAQQGTDAFPDSTGGRLCRNLITEIEAKEANITTERVWNAPWPNIHVRYRNIEVIHFRAIAHDWTSLLKGRDRQPQHLTDEERKELLAKRPVLEWSSKLPPTPDYKERIESVPAPDQLKPGFYYLLASHDSEFGGENNQVSYADIWVSDLALVIRSWDGKLQGFVLEANSGEPVADAEVRSWYRDDRGRYAEGPQSRTDTNGFFSFSPQQHRGYFVLARHNGRELASHQEHSAYAHDRSRHPHDQTLFFTDRALYRPGQTIHYKGICVHVDQQENDYELLRGRDLTVVFADQNGKEIARQLHRCNDYGSFAGSFTAPRDRLMGSMQLHVVNGPSGSTRFNVEEYKRPKFQVTLEAPKTAPRLDDKVALSGMALSYAGAAVDGAQVRYRVVREVRWPYWWGWHHSWRMRHVSANQEIAHGTITTDAEGAFNIEFVARPDPKVSSEDEVAFNFSIYADVTDSSGETRSAQRSIQVGFTALRATLTASEWQTSTNPVQLTISTTTLDAEPQTAEGAVKVHRLKAPEKVHRPYMGEISSYWSGPTPEMPDLSNPDFWELGEVVAEKGFTTDADGSAKMQFDLEVGVYRAMLETQDRFGKKVTARLQLKVLEPAAAKFAIKIPHLVTAPDWVAQPGDEFTALWGTGYDRGQAFVEIEHRQNIIRSYWTKPEQTQHQITQGITEAMRGGFTLHVTYVRENRAYLESRRVDVPWDNKNLDLSWEHFTSKLQPGQKETWTLVIKSALTNATAKGPQALAEFVGALYDESLDAFLPHNWMARFNFFYHDHSRMNRQFENATKHFQWIHGQWNRGHLSADRTYRHFPPDLVANFWGYQFARGARGGVYRMKNGMADDARFYAGAAPAAVAETAAAPSELRQEKLAADTGGARQDAPGTPPPPKGPDLSQVTARKNLNETAFFFPQLLCDSNGVVKLQFTMPEALTKWRFLGFAHDQQLRSGFLEGHTVTAKDLMVQPNPPRFLREGDVLEFTVKISNQSAARQTGKVRLTFNQALNDDSADKLLGNSEPELSFDIPSKESRSYSWRIKVPDGIGFLTYKAVASTGKISDGEEGYLPVLSRLVFVTESLPLPIRGPGTKTFEFTKLLKSGRSDTLQHQNVTVQMVSQPAWYAVLALPYLMEYPHQCSEQVFNRLYANSVGRYIANSDPKIRRIFDQWKNTAALDSPLEKNQDLKSVMLEETPWLRQAQNESQARRNVGILFDDNRMEYEIGRAFQQLSEMQLPDGAWPWFPGGRGNDYITLYIVTGFGRMRHLGIDANIESAVRALTRLDNWMHQHYLDIQKWPNPEEYVPSPNDALYLYARGFFLKDQAIAAAHKPAIEFFLKQSRAHWLKVANRQSQGHLALGLKRFNAVNGFKDATPVDIMKSIHERSVSNEEMGMFWRETELSWWWYRAPIETQALMIEAFDEVMNDARAVEDCKVWLLKQKQTQDWKTTKATADAVYALLLRGRDLLSSEALVQVTVGGLNITPDPAKNSTAVEPGTGFYEKRFAPAEIKPKLGQIIVKKSDEGVAWGSIHWQYLEDIAKVTPHEGTPLKLKKALYTKTNTKTGPVIAPVTGAINVGDELVVRVELRVDRDMEYVHLKDQRGSGTEPVNVISRYKYQDGLAYYESTRDTASHFFIDYLPKGVYVFEYSTRVVHKGEYQTGLADIQCMYAPEFNSHSQSVEIQVN